jgi:opacity protein-like surface antigen
MVQLCAEENGMKRVLSAAALAVTIATPAAAQWAGMPVWNSPKGGTGITISGDYARPNADWGKGNAFGARGTVGLGSLSVTAGFASWKPEGASSVKSFGGDAAFRVIGGTLLPINVNLLVGGARSTQSASPDVTSLLAGGGVSVSLPTPGISIEPYVSLTNRWRKPSGGSTDSNFGWTLGANLGFGGIFGAHLAYDSESLGGGSTGGIIGIGAHLALKVPLGM